MATRRNAIAKFDGDAPNPSDIELNMCSDPRCFGRRVDPKIEKYSARVGFCRILDLFGLPQQTSGRCQIYSVLSSGIRNPQN